MTTKLKLPQQGELVTIRDYIRWAITEFNKARIVFGHGTDNAWDEAVNLVLSSLNLQPDIDANVLDAKLTSDECELVTSNIKDRIEKRIPVPYLVQEAWFAGISFYVDERVIIPRSPIAEIIEEELSPWVEGENIENVLDLCTGSGCIAVTLALAFPDAKVDAVDLDKDAIEVAKINVERFGLEDCVNVIQGDLFEKIEGKKYDVIISNPPYVGKDEYDELSPEYHHEPRQALYADDDGLKIVAEILKSAEKHLTPTGVLIVEVGYSKDLLEARFPAVPFTWLQFERGGEGVFLLTQDELREFKHLFNAG